MSRHALSQTWRKLGIPPDYATSRQLPIHREAKRLVSIGRAADDGKRLRLTPRAATAWRDLQAAAANDGFTLLPLSAFRSIARQTTLIRRKLARGQAIADILVISAAPGCSEHHTGRALDLGAPGHLELETSFARTREFRWLKKHALRFGFNLSYPRRNPHGISYEPWHWCWYPRASGKSLR